MLEVGEGSKLEEDEMKGSWRMAEVGVRRRRLEEGGGGGWSMAEDRGWCLEETGGGWRKLKGVEAVAGQMAGAGPTMLLTEELSAACSSRTPQLYMQGSSWG